MIVDETRGYGGVRRKPQRMTEMPTGEKTKKNLLCVSHNLLRIAKGRQMKLLVTGRVELA
jgi:hypothetical protein